MNHRPIDTRVETSLRRLGYTGIRAVRVNEAHVDLVGELPVAEHPIVVAVAKTVPGVKIVTSKLQPAK